MCHEKKRTASIYFIMSKAENAIRLLGLLLCILLSLVIANQSLASEGAIMCTVLDSLTEEPVPDAEISFEAWALKCRTNIEGLCRIFPIKPGLYRIRISASGYDEKQEEFVLRSGEQRKVKILLQKLKAQSDSLPKGTVHDEITVTPQKFEPDTRNVRAITVSHLPGAAEDPFKAFQTTAGVLGRSEADSRLYIRGSPPSENLVLLDGVPVYDPYRLFGLVTLFDPETISYFTIRPGGFSAKYGDRLSAVVEVANRYGTMNEQLKGGLNMSFTSSSALLEGSLPGLQNRGSWMLTMRRTYYDVMLKAFDASLSQFPYFFDVQSRFYFQPNSRHDISLFAIYSHEGTNLNEEFEGEFSSVDLTFLDKQRAQIVGINDYFHVSDQLMVRHILSFYRNSQRSDAKIVGGTEPFVTTFNIELRTDEWMLQQQWEGVLSASQLLEAGFTVSRNPATTELSIASDDPSVVIPDELKHFSSDSVNVKYAGYLQDTWTPVESIEGQWGIRFDQQSLSGLSRYSPRASFSWSPSSKHRFRFAYGWYYHFPNYESLQSEGLLFDLETLDELHLRPERAIHYVAGYDFELSENRRFTLDIYHKELDQLLVGKVEEYTLPVLQDDNSIAYETVTSRGIEPTNAERGYARGLELTFENNSLFNGKLDLKFSYSLAKTVARADDEPFRPRYYDQRHTANLVGYWHVTKKLEVSFTWRYGSGFPYTPPGRVLTVVLDADGDGQYNPKSGDVLSYYQINDPEDSNSRRYPPYHRLDMRITYTMEFQSSSIEWYIDIINLYNRENVISYEYSDDFSERKEVNGFPFLPSFGFHYRF